MRKLLAPILCLALAGCATAKAPTPATAPDPYHRAANIMVEFSGDLVTLEAAEKNLYIGSVIDKDTHRTINQAFKTLAQVGPQIDALIAAEASSATIAAKVNVALQQLSTITLSTANIDTATKLQISAGVQAIYIVLQGVTTQLNTTGGN